MKLHFKLWHFFAVFTVVAVAVWFALHSDYVLVYTGDDGWRYGQWDEVFKQ